MMRRAANAALLAPAVWLAMVAWRDSDADPRRAAVMGALAIGGALMNGSGIALSTLGFRRWLRVLSAVVGGLIACGLIVTGLVFTQYVLPSIPNDESVLRAAVTQSSVRFFWIGGATAYATCAVLLLPPERRRGGEIRARSASEGGRKRSDLLASEGRAPALDE